MAYTFLSNCCIDQWTEAASGVHDINYLIDNLVTSISYDHAPKFQRKTRNSSPLKIDYPLINFLNDTCLTLDDTTTYVTEILLRNLIFESLHTQFFKGHFFFGIASHSLSSYFPNMMIELIDDGKFLIFF